MSLRVTGVRADGYHELDADMVTLDLADELVIDEAGRGSPSASAGAAARPGCRAPTTWWSGRLRLWPAAPASG